MKSFELEPLNASSDSDRKTGSSGSDGDDDCSDTRFFTIVCCGCLGCILLVALCAFPSYLAWKRHSTCSALQGQSTEGWNTMLPPNTTMQMLPGFFSFFYHEVDVRPATASSHDTAKLGFWSDMNVLFALQRYSYTDTRGAAESVTLEARQPWGLYLGMRYDIWRCAGDQTDGFSIVEDWWARPWFNWQSAATFDIVDHKTGTTIARSNSHKDNGIQGIGLTKYIRSKEIDVLDMQGNRIAHTYQQSQIEAGFSYRRYFVTNLHPQIVPNEVVSFLGAVWEIQGAQKSEAKHQESNSQSSYSSESRRRRTR